MNNELIIACMLGNTAEVKRLIEAGADINAKGEDGEAPLHWAAMYGYKDIAKMLIKAGADVNAKDKYLLIHAAKVERTDKHILGIKE